MFLHSFLPQQPDLNWDNPEVVEAMSHVMRFWLDRGVDGFRIDALPLLGKDPLLLSNADPTNPWGEHNIDWPSVHERIAHLRQLCDGYADRILVGETNVTSLAHLARYSVGPTACHLAHSFLFLQQPWNANALHEFLRSSEQEFSSPALPSWYLGNHDNPRVRTRLGNPESARAAAVFLLTVRGVPFIYQGEELGLPDAHIPEGYLQDIDRREPQRAPMPWANPQKSAFGGFSTVAPWLPVHDQSETLNVADEQADPRSFLNLYRELLQLRAASAALHAGQMRLLGTYLNVLGFARSAEGDQITTLLNFNDHRIGLDKVSFPGLSDAVAILSSSAERTNLNKVTYLLPYEALVFRRGRQISSLTAGRG